MTKEEFAARLDGREYRNEMTAEEEAEAKRHGLLVVFGASDDLMEFRGAFDDEVGCFDGGSFRIDKEGVYDIQLLAGRPQNAKYIKARWCDGTKVLRDQTRHPSEGVRSAFAGAWQGLQRRASRRADLFRSSFSNSQGVWR